MPTNGYCARPHECECAPEAAPGCVSWRSAPSEPAAPIDMVLHCPSCGMQHIDAPDPAPQFAPPDDVWTNPPHRSHLCHGCGHVWRPADVPTNGVAAVKTKGEKDSPIVETLDLQRVLWSQLTAAAQASNWIPQDHYYVNDWVSDCCRFLRGERAEITDEQWQAIADASDCLLPARLKLAIEAVLRGSR